MDHSTTTPFFPLPTPPMPQFDMGQLEQVLDQEFEARLNSTLTKTAELIELLHQDVFSLGIADLASAHAHLSQIHDTLLWLVDLQTARMILAQSHNYRAIQEYAENHIDEFAPLMPLFWHLMSDLQFDDMCSMNHLPNSACTLSEPLACALLQETFSRPVSVPPQNLYTGIAYSIYSARPVQLKLYLDYCKKNILSLARLDFIVLSPTHSPLVDDSMTLYAPDGWIDSKARVIHLTSGSLNVLQAALLSANSSCAQVLLDYQSFDTIIDAQFQTALSHLLAQTQWDHTDQHAFSQRANQAFLQYQSHQT